MRLSLVVAAARNDVIGLRGKIPWRLPDDQLFFKTVTTGHCVVMGRKTFDSIGRPLPGRINLVLSRRPHEPVDQVEFFLDLPAALAWARAQNVAECFIAGGEAIYRESLAHADRVLLTRVEAEPEGDTFFPELDPKHWRCVDREAHAIDERHAHTFAIETWNRVD
jgi:dihydrofolate reductase